MSIGTVMVTGIVSRKGDNGWRNVEGMVTALRRPEYTLCKVNFAKSTFADQVAPPSFSKRDQDESMGGNYPWKIESMCHRLVIWDYNNYIPSFPGIELLVEEDGFPLWDEVDWEDIKFEHAAESN
ncbi:hypothetical protein N7519_007840 [Penicillium mononematosum]|uniref:uncharacterized protein n=1 Tax=Penicillium mononematosum TaxID=268346 RepID=UPI002549BE9D|nr:uncharacterized protein N7519_007840 [Penicillium mononematosum]KAJ6186539.1 hypothetical protein N7519_007840 [Penicillium mononematosum]